MSFLLDTNICIPFLNGTDASIRKQFQQVGHHSLRLCSVVQAELLYGARKSEKTSENLVRLDKLFELLEVIDFDQRAAHHYGIIRAQLEREGTPIGGNDLMIGAIALAHDLTLVTRNLKEFRRIVGLKVVEW